LQYNCVESYKQNVRFFLYPGVFSSHVSGIVINTVKVINSVKSIDFTDLQWRFV